MDPDLTSTHKKLRSLRDRQDLRLKGTPMLKETFVLPDGRELPLKLRYYQIQMIFHLLAMRNFVVGDDTGLGKTLETIASLCYLWGLPGHKDRKVIVLAKKAAVLQWAGEFDKFTNGVRVIVSKGTAGQRKKAYAKFQAATGPVVLISGYRSMVRDVREVQEWKDYVFVCDEATVFKNPGTQIHQLCKHMSGRADRIWALTATLIKNNLMEGFGIMQVVVPGLFTHTATSFMNDYCIVRMQRVKGNRQIPVLVGYRSEQIERFKDKIDPYYLGRPKHEVAEELPVLTIRNVEVGMNSFQKKLYQDALEGLLEKGDGEEKETDKLTALIYCQQIVDHPALLEYPESSSEKMDALIDMLTDGGEFEGEKVVIYTRFKKMVNHAIPVLEKKKVKCVRVTGDENEQQRQDAMDTFTDLHSGVNVIWITDAGGDSINLQAGKALIFYDCPWSAGDYLQILGRIIRIGSLHDRVYALHLLCKGTIDSRVQDVKNKKMKLIEAILGQRIKGEKEAPTVYEVESSTSELYDYLMEDAQGGQ
jgi:SNF2 family DNA or RNA helicase